VPTATVVTTAFLDHARHAADSLGIADLPLLITPHPLNDLTEPQVGDLARAAFPLIRELLAGAARPARETVVPFVHPAQRARQVVGAGRLAAPAPRT